VRLGSTVRVREEGSFGVITWKVVNPGVGPRKEGELSARSPVGSALLGHAVGEVVEATTRRGTRRLTILEVAL
jgi:transcription elongation factor GreA